MRRDAAFSTPRVRAHASHSSWPPVLHSPVLLSGANSLEAESARTALLESWRAKGVVVLRAGSDAAKRTTPNDLVSLSKEFGEVEMNPGVKKQFLWPGIPQVQVLGNVRREDGEPRALFQSCQRLDHVKYDPIKRAPVWHTDQLFRNPQPRGSLLMCITGPPVGGGTAFASTELSESNLPQELIDSLRDKVLVMSYAHHNAACRRGTPSYPLLTAEQRAKYPPITRPLITRAQANDEEVLNCFNSSVMAVLPSTAPPLQPDEMEHYETTGEKHDSVEELYSTVLPLLTAQSYVHHWEPGDVVIWDNERCVHAATWYDSEKYAREMWRTTFR